MTDDKSVPQKGPSKFEQVAQTNKSLPREILGMLGKNRKWWLLPVIVSFAIIAVLALLSTTAAAPFIYTFF